MTPEQEPDETLRFARGIVWGCAIGAAMWGALTWAVAARGEEPLTTSILQMKSGGILASTIWCQDARDPMQPEPGVFQFYTTTKTERCYAVGKDGMIDHVDIDISNAIPVFRIPDNRLCDLITDTNVPTCPDNSAIITTGVPMGPGNNVAKEK
jgi:hypothetical protein